MPQYKALLIGASNYEMPGVPPLPFVSGDLRRLESVLERRGFHDVQVLSTRPDGKQVSANYVNAKVSGFLRRARRGDTLLILLSGHGVHARGRDFLVPEDIDEDMHPFESGCVPIDWRQQLDETLAEHVVILIDACREGIDQASMGVAGVSQWGKQKIGAALRRKVAYMYACSPAQVALFVRADETASAGTTHGTTPGESFSLFSRSVSDVVARYPGTEVLPLGAFMEAVQDRVTELHRAYGKKGQPQIVRVVTDIPSDRFFFLPRTGQPLPPVTPAVSAATARAGSAMALGTVGRPSFTYPPSPPAKPPAPVPRQVPRRSRAAKADGRHNRWIRRAMVSGVVLLVAFSVLIGCQKWINGQYFVGASGEHVAIYRGVNHNVAGISFSDTYMDHPEIELKYLPPYQRKQVENTITMDNVDQARTKVFELAAQASACKKDEQRRDSGGNSLSGSEEERRLAASCGKQ
ncbi:caspase domain-containing protein [Streptomyces sp. NPDC002870]|uniref:caspase family protein n=1 Tax=Streptomyces sp. NPDC002870 TaxID=3364666 RepID=UPI0036D0AE77